MILDKNLTLVEKLPISPLSVGVHSTGDTIDLGQNPPYAPGSGSDLHWIVYVNQSLAGGSSTKVRFILRHSDSESGNFDEFLASHVCPVEEVIANDEPLFVLPFPYSNVHRFIRMAVNVTGGALTNGGSVSSFVTLDPPRRMVYADAL